MLDLAEYDAATRADLYTFVQRVHATLNPGTPFLENWHVEMMCSELMAIYAGEHRRAIFNLPPRNLKSICISVAFVAWVLGQDPTRRFMVVSYGQELADKHARDCRTIMVSDWYRRLFSKTELVATRTAAHDFETTMGGGRMAGSRGGPITGRGAHFIILDDPIKAEEALTEVGREAAGSFVASTLINRHDDKINGAIIVAMQRLHEDDVSGRLLKTGRWRHICIPAIAQEDELWRYTTPWGPRLVRRAKGEALNPALEPLDILEDLRAIQGEHHFSAQYLQNPIPIRGDIVPIEKFIRYEPSELPESFEETLFSIDTASKAHELANFSVVTHWGRKGKAIYLLGVWRFRATYFELKTRVRALAHDLRPMRVLIEDTSAGQQLIQEFIHEGLPGVIACPAKGDKATRMSQAAILIEGGDVHIPGSAAWLAPYLHELAAFPNGAYDDQADSTSQALNWFRERRFEPNVARYYREEREKLQGGREPNVLMRAKPECGLATGIEGHEYRPDPVTHLVRVRQIDVASFRGAGWVVIE